MISRSGLFRLEIDLENTLNASTETCTSSNVLTRLYEHDKTGGITAVLSDREYEVEYTVESTLQEGETVAQLVDEINVGIGSGFVDIDTDSIQLLIDNPNGG